MGVQRTVNMDMRERKETSDGYIVRFWEVRASGRRIGLQRWREDKSQLRRCVSAAAQSKLSVSQADNLVVVKQ